MTHPTLQEARKADLMRRIIEDEIWSDTQIISARTRATPLGEKVYEKKIMVKALQLYADSLRAEVVDAELDKLQEVKA